MTGQNNADTMIQFNDVAQSAFPLMQEVSAVTSDFTFIFLQMSELQLLINFGNVSFSPFCVQLVRLQASAVFQEARELNFQQDMIGSFNMLLCGEQPDFSSNVMTLISRSSTQMSGFQSIFITGNTSGKCYICSTSWNSGLNH